MKTKKKVTSDKYELGTPQEVKVLAKVSQMLHKTESRYRVNPVGTLKNALKHLKQRRVEAKRQVDILNEAIDLVKTKMKGDKDEW